MRDDLAILATDAIFAAAAHRSNGGRRMGPAERMQLKIAKALGLPPVSLSRENPPAAVRTRVDSGTSGTQPVETLAEESLALVRAFSRIHDPKVRRSLLQMVEAAADPE